MLISETYIRPRSYEAIIFDNVSDASFSHGLRLIFNTTTQERRRDSLSFTMNFFT